MYTSIIGVPRFTLHWCQHPVAIAHQCSVKNSYSGFRLMLGKALRRIQMIILIIGLSWWTAMNAVGLASGTLSPYFTLWGGGGGDIFQYPLRKYVLNFDMESYSWVDCILYIYLYNSLSRDNKYLRISTSSCKNAHMNIRQCSGLLYYCAYESPLHPI